MTKRLLAALAVTLALAPAAEAKIWRDPASLNLAQVPQDLSKGGPVLKAVFTPAGDFGLMVGGWGASYLTDSFYLGGVGIGGGLTQGKGGVGYGGVVVGTEQKLGSRTILDWSLIIGGGGGGTNNQDAGGTFALEPSVSISRLIGEGIRGTIGLGYLYMPTLNTFSGVTLNLSLGFKTLTLRLPVDD